MEKMPLKCDWILRHGANVGQTKREIIAHLATLDHTFDIAYEQCRLRKKFNKRPMEIYNDSDKFGDDIRLSEHVEVLQKKKIVSFRLECMLTVTVSFQDDTASD